MYACLYTYKLILVYSRLKEKEDGERIPTQRADDDDLSGLMPSSKRAKHFDKDSEVERSRHRTQDSDVSRHKTKREKDATGSDSRYRTESHVREQGTKKKKLKEKKVEEISRKENWLSSNLRVRIVDKKMGRLYNSKVIVTAT